MSFVLRCAVALLCGLASATAAAAGPTTKPAWHGDLAAARAFMVDAAKLYELKHKGAVAVKALGTVSALEALSLGRIDLAASARAGDARIPAEQDLEFTPVVWDSLVLVTYPGNPVGNVSLKQLRDIYFGRIRNWSELGGPPKPINLYAVAGPHDGVEYALRRILFGNGAANVAAQRWYINTKQLEDAIAIDPAGLGVSTLSNVHGNRAVKLLSIEGVAPSLATLEDGQYLLAAPLYLAARKEAPGQPGTTSLAREALAFFRSEPALARAWRDKQLLPFTEARKLAAVLPTREKWIAGVLGIDTTPPKPAGPPLPLAPPKTTPVNRVATVEPLREARPFKGVIVAQPEQDKNTLDPAVAAAKIDACRPTPVC